MDSFWHHYPWWSYDWWSDPFIADESCCDYDYPAEPFPLFPSAPDAAPVDPGGRPLEADEH
jgi:hypothetical protein